MEAFYKSYFENLARTNKRILHTDNQPAFFYIDDKYNPEAFDNAIKSMAKTPALLLEQYGYEADESGNRTYIKDIMGQFNILIKTQKGERATIEFARSESEAIADLIIARMRKDFEAFDAFQLADGSDTRRIQYKVKCKVEPIGPINADYYGVTVLFKWNTPFTAQATSDEWTDL